MFSEKVQLIDIHYLYAQHTHGHFLSYTHYNSRHVISYSQQQGMVTTNLRLMCER